MVAAMIGIVSCAPGDSPLPQSDSAGLPSATSTPAPVSPTVQPSPTNTPTALASPTSRPTATPSQAPTDTPTLAATASPTSDGPAREYGDSFRNRDLVPEPDGHRDGDRVSDGDRDINAGTASDCHSNSRATDRHRFTRSTTNRNASASADSDSVPCTRGGR